MENRYNRRFKKTELYIWLKSHAPEILSLPGVREMLEDLPVLHRETLQNIRDVIVLDPDTPAEVLAEVEKLWPIFELEVFLNSCPLGPFLSWSYCYTWSDALQAWTHAKTGLPVVWSTEPEEIMIWPN